MTRAPLVLATAGAAQTQDLAAALGAIAQPGDLILLAGEMGAGKTAFAQGFARGLGITDQVTSPTFTIVQEYGGGRLNMHHLDVYRLETLREVADLGLSEMLDEELHIPFTAQKVVAEIRAKMRILSEAYDAEGLTLRH